MSDIQRRTRRRYAHELYPHADECEIRPLSVEVPYLYARAIGYRTSGTEWFAAEREESAARVRFLLDARGKALMCDALLQGMTGDEAWEWAESRMDEAGEWVYERAIHYGVPVSRIKPYPCGPKATRHEHGASTGDSTGEGVITLVDGTEGDCEACTEPAGSEARS